MIDGLSYRALIMSLLAEPSHFKITVNSVDLTQPGGSIDLDVEVMEDGADISNMYVRMSVVEDHVSYPGDLYHDVNRVMPAAVPVTVNNLGEVQNVVANFTLDPTWVEANMSVVIFLQDDTTKKVHNTASSAPTPDYGLRFYALGERQVVGPSTGSFYYEDFRVYNTGTVTDNYTCDVTGLVPPGWAASLCDDSLCYGPTYSQSLAPGEFFDLHVLIQPDGPGYASVEIEIRQDNLAHSFPRAIGYAYITDDLDVLLVDDDGAEAYEEYFIDALSYSGYSYGVWNRLAGPAENSILSEFPVVIWNVGLSYPTVDDADRAALSEYLDGGGALFISGQDIGWEMNDIGGAALQWYHEYLHADFVGDDTNQYNLAGVPGDPVTDGLDIVIQGGDGANNQAYPSDIDPYDPSATIIWTYNALANGALRADTGTYRVVYTAFGYEGINNADDRRASMMRIMTWLEAGSVGVGGESPTHHAFLRSAPNPANLATTLEFSLPFAGDTKLKVYGTDGRLVRTLVERPMTAGTHAFNWNLTDTRGKRLPAGVYFYRLQADEVEMTRKILLIK